jgi:hypothetical protein
VLTAPAYNSYICMCHWLRIQINPFVSDMPYDTYRTEIKPSRRSDTKIKPLHLYLYLYIYIHVIPV